MNLRTPRAMVLAAGLSVLCLAAVPGASAQSVSTNPTTGVVTVTNISTAEYNNWATFNGQPLASTAAGAAIKSQIEQMVNAARLSNLSLPLDFFHIPLPQGFATTNANAFNITTLTGFKEYRLRQAYSPNFGQLRELGLPRYIQFGIKIYF